MPTIRFRETPLVREILILYKDLRTKLMEISTNSILEIPLAEQGWGVFLGLTYKEGMLEGLEYPQPGKLSSLARQVQEQNPNSTKIKQNCDYFNFVYNTCYQYIADNQNRYFGRANLNDNSHGKVLAMTLLAHLCQQALEKPVDKHDKYIERIRRFTTGLLNHSDIQNTSSQDDTLLSCKSALNRIFNSEKSNDSEDENKIDTYYDRINDTTRELNELLIEIDNHLLPLFSVQNQIDATHLQQLFEQKDQLLTASERTIANDPFVAEMFGQASTALRKDDYLGLYNGINYQLFEKNNFLWDQFEIEQKENLIKLLKLRDKLRVLQNELRTLYQFSSGNKISYFNDFIKLSEPYLKDIHRVKSELNVCLEKFEADCGQVYRTRYIAASSARNQWEPFYLNKLSLIKVREHFITTSKKISAAFASIPFDFFNALKNFSEEAKEVVKRGYSLFGNEFDMASSSFQSDISRAQAKELNRQAELILIKQKGILAEYDELLQQAAQSPDESVKKLVEILERRRAVVYQIIKAIELQTKNCDEEEGFVLIESNGIESKVFEEEHQTTSFFQVIRNYLARPPVSTLEYQELQEQLKKLGIELKLVEENNLSLQQENKNKGELISQQQKQIQDFSAELKGKNDKLSLITDMANFTLFDSSNFRLLLQRITNNQTDNIRELFTVISHIEAIIQQGRNYEETYQLRASEHDSSFFFSHNQNGQRHAYTIMKQWENHLYSITNKTLTDMLKSHEPIDAGKLNKFTQTLTDALVVSMNNLIIKEDYSSYKQHSFRNYLSHFHQHLMDNGHLKIQLNANAQPIKEVNEIFDTVNDSFDKEKLEAFEESIQDNQMIRS